MENNRFTSESAAIEDLRKRGFTSTFVVENEGIRSTTTKEFFRPEELILREFHRFEGASDPEDMSVVYAVESKSGTRGVIVDAFGPYSEPALASLIEKMPLQSSTKNAKANKFLG